MVSSLALFVAALHAEQGRGWRLAAVLDELVECWREGLSGEEAAIEILGAFPPQLGYPVDEGLAELEASCQELLDVVTVSDWCAAVRAAMEGQGEA